MWRRCSRARTSSPHVSTPSLYRGWHGAAESKLLISRTSVSSANYASRESSRLVTHSPLRIRSTVDKPNISTSSSAASPLEPPGRPITRLNGSWAILGMSGGRGRQALSWTTRQVNWCAAGAHPGLRCDQRKFISKRCQNTRERHLGFSTSVFGVSRVVCPLFRAVSSHVDWPVPITEIAGRSALCDRITIPP